MSKSITAGPDDHPVTIGTNTVSMKVIQSIYNEITGKSEKLIKRFQASQLATYADIEQLNIKIEQQYEQYHIESKNCAVSLYYIDACKEQFSSFERFSFYNPSALNAVETIRLEYNFLIILPSTYRAQTYKVEIALHSRAASYIRAKSEAIFLPHYFRYFGDDPGTVEIEYVDYTVARNFLHTIEQWFSSIKTAESPSWIKWIQRRSETLPFLFKLLSTPVITWALVWNAETFFPVGASFVDLFRAGAVGLAATYFILMVADKLGTACEHAIDSYAPVSALKLNRGDEHAMREYALRYHRYSGLKAVGSFVLVIILNLISAWIASSIDVGS